MCNETLDCASLDLGRLLGDSDLLDNVVRACHLATERCAHKIMMVLGDTRVLCLTTTCTSDLETVEEEEVMEEIEELEDWVRPAVCISIMLVAVIFFSFMYFGRSWLEGTVKVRLSELGSR